MKGILVLYFASTLGFCSIPEMPSTAAMDAAGAHDLGTTDQETSSTLLCENAPSNAIELDVGEAEHAVDRRCYARAIVDSSLTAITFRPPHDAPRRSLTYRCRTGIVDVRHDNDLAADRATWREPWYVHCLPPTPDSEPTPSH